MVTGQEPKAQESEGSGPTISVKLGCLEKTTPIALSLSLYICEMGRQVETGLG